METICRATKIGELYLELEYFPVMKKGLISYGSEELGTFTFSVCNNWVTMHVKTVAEITPYMFKCIYNLFPKVGIIKIDN